MHNLCPQLKKGMKIKGGHIQQDIQQFFFLMKRGHQKLNLNENPCHESWVTVAWDGRKVTITTTQQQKRNEKKRAKINQWKKIN